MLKYILIGFILGTCAGYAQEYIFTLPEITEEQDNAYCVRYTNRLQRSQFDEEVWKSPYGDVVFKFFREDAEIPDTVQVWDNPPNTIVVPNSLTLEEHDHDLFCIEQFKGS